MLFNRLEGERDTHLYWTYFIVWICALFPAVFATALFFYLFRHSDTRWVVPIAMAILWAPLVALGIYGIIKGYSASWRYGYVYRGTKALVWNILSIVIYVIILVVVLIVGGDTFL